MNKAIKYVIMIFIAFLIIPLLFGPEMSGNVAVIPIRGVLMVDGGYGVASSTQIIDFIQQAESDPLIEAIVFDINTPGGSAVASDEISRYIEFSSKPTVSLIREVGASGGYWIASSTKHIIANPLSITGSIGVIGSYLQFEGLFEEFGIKSERFVAGDLKDLGTPYREISDSEREILQSKLDLIHQDFINHVTLKRNLSSDNIKVISTGEFFIGKQAYEIGLIDELGSWQELEVYLNNLEIDPTYRKYEVEPSLFDLFSAKMPGLKILAQ